MKKILFLFQLLMITLLSSGFAIKLFLPSAGGQEDVHSLTQAYGDKSTIDQIIQIMNEYLWFFVIFIVFILLSYAGFKIITAQGDKDNLNKGYNLIIAAGIVVFVSIFSYGIVQLIANLL